MTDLGGETNLAISYVNAPRVGAPPMGNLGSAPAFVPCLIVNLFFRSKACRAVQQSDGRRNHSINWYVTSNGSFPPTETDSDSDSDSNPIVTLYYAPLFLLVRIWIPVRILSEWLLYPF